MTETVTKVKRPLWAMLNITQQRHACKYLCGASCRASASVHIFSRWHSRRTLRGRVCNNTTGVLIDVEGCSEAIEGFINEIKLNPPPLSLIESIEHHGDLDPANYADFRIVESTTEGEHFVPISADIATCHDCLSELLDPKDRRYRYPFINCTNCGPRFTIIEDIPYDRAADHDAGFRDVRGLPHRVFESARPSLSRGADGLPAMRAAIISDGCARVSRRA